MKRFKIFTISVITIIVLLFGFLILNYVFSHKQKTDTTRDFPEIAKEGTLRVIINTNPIDYFIYQGQPMGLQLEMLESFAKTHNLILEIIVENNPEKGMELLLSRECDILAQSLSNLIEKDVNYDFTIPVRQTKQVLVQRILNEDDPRGLIRDLSELELKTIYCSKNSRNSTNFNNLYSLSSKNYYVVEIDSIPDELLIQKVSEGLIDYVICDYDIAKIAQSYYPNIDIETDISLAQDISWCVRHESKVLLDSLNNWLEYFIESEDYKKIIRKYINNNRLYVDINSEFYSGNEGRICDYDSLIKKYSPIIGWDWRLLASLIFEESRFNPDVVSWAGAVGIMQLMPLIYNKYTDPNLSGQESEIYAGVNYIRFLYTSLSHTASDSANMVKFVLASYNIGPGHIEDAMRLASKHEKNAGSWDDVSYYLINLSNPKYYNDTCVKHGYFPGIYAVAFANSISNRYKHYINIIPE
ncbi:MAG: transporter substrate-binding domain-containing protein [Bacteroidales bacterium]|nr:transporter substrate-binding domain-containing protein [Bacteroidales bacterium]